MRDSHMSKRSTKAPHISRRMDVPGAALLAAVVAALLGILFTLAAPRANADANAFANAMNAAGQPSKTSLSKKFKGKLPITQLTEDEAILHALDRLAYGPRPGDVEHIRKIGLEKWIDQQLNPDSIDDSALDERMSSYSTLKMSPEQLLAKYPEQNQVIKKEGITKEEYEQQMKEKREAAVAEVKLTGNDNLDKANQQVARLQGPGRMLAELSMAKVDRAIYSQRQLEAVMEDFWFNHFNVFGNKGDDRWLVSYYVRDTIRPHTMGKFQDLLIATAKSPAMLFYLDNWLSADPAAYQKFQQQKSAARFARYQGGFQGGMPPTPGTFPG